jgi:hypothetical protein
MPRAITSSTAPRIPARDTGAAIDALSLDDEERGVEIGAHARYLTPKPSFPHRTVQVANGLALDRDTGGDDVVADRKRRQLDVGAKQDQGTINA